MVIMDFGGFADAALYINLMMTIGIVMMLLFGHLYFALWPRFRKAVEGGAFPDAAKTLDRIRRTVTINLVLGDHHDRYRRNGALLVSFSGATLSP